jgi:thiamine-monophosphate kinase
MNTTCRDLPFTVHPGHLLAIAMDTLNRGVHFPVATAADAIGWKAIAVNLSDLAAMGAEPLYCSVHLYHDHDDAFVRTFTAGCEQISNACQVPFALDVEAVNDLSVTVQVYGQVPEAMALRRDGARVGDGIYISGCLGDAALALSAVEMDTNVYTAARQRLDRPQPRLALGRQLRGTASSAIDISDGLLADLGHIMQASGVGARLVRDQVPLSGALQTLGDRQQAWQLALGGGDDYELCFTVPAAREQQLRALNVDVSITRIGEIIEGKALQLMDSAGRAVAIDQAGYEHFTGEPHGQ